MKLLCILALSTLLLWSCSSSPTKPEPTPDYNMTIISDGDSLELAWDPPSDTAKSINFYELSYRNVSDKNWKVLLDSITMTSATIYRSQLGTGTFELAVRSVAAEGQKSDYHKSTDEDAVPTGGWILEWK